MAKQSIEVLGLTPGQNYSIAVYSVTTDSNGIKHVSPYSQRLAIETPAVSGNGSNFSLVNSGTDITLDGGSLLAGTFPPNSGQIDVVNDEPDATGVVLNQSGLAGFNEGAKQFYISAVNGDAWFAGEVAANATISGVTASSVVANAASGVLKNKTFYQNDAPTNPTDAIQTGDLWYDTNDGYKAYRWSGTTWQSIQDGLAVTANNAAIAAQSSADGKSRIVYGTAGSTGTKGYAPNNTEYEVTLNGSIDTFSSSYTTTTGNKVGDTWFVRNNVGSIIAQYTVTSFTAPDTSVWTRTKVEGMVIGNLDAGKITVGTLSVGLGITTGTGNITLNASTGKLTATNVELTGAITATSGSFTGEVYASSGTFTGQITSTSGTIGGWTIGTDTIFSGTSELRSSDGSAVLGDITGFGDTYIYGTISSSGSNAIQAGGAVTAGSYVEAVGYVRAYGELYAAGHSTTTNTANGYVFPSGGRIARYSPSSEKYKENITDITNVPELNPRKLLEIPIRAFSYKEGVVPNTDDRYMHMIPGFIAEEVDEVYPIAADYVDGIETINDRMILAGALALIQEQEKRIKALEDK